LIVHEYKPTIKRNEELEAQFLQVAKRWSEHRSLNSHFLGLNLFDYYELKRYFYGTVHEELIAFMSCAPIFARNGYLFEDVVRDPNAPYGAIELMTLEALAQFKEEGKLIATFGISPRLDPIDMDKLPFKGRAIIKSAVWCANTFMNLQGLHHFRKKFSTERAESMYLVKYPEGFSIRDLVAILRSFNIV
jgi:phosphatidylglycerol lysyltransferase